MPAGVVTTSAGGSRVEQRIDRIDTHLRIECADDEFANRDRAPLRKERAHSQVRIDANDQRGIDVAVGERADSAVVDALAHEREGDRRA